MLIWLLLDRVRWISTTIDRRRSAKVAFFSKDSITTIVHSSFDGDEDDQPASYSIDDIKTKLMVFDPKVADDMWFV